MDRLIWTWSRQMKMLISQYYSFSNLIASFIISISTVPLVAACKVRYVLLVSYAVWTSSVRDLNQSFKTFLTLVYIIKVTKSFYAWNLKTIILKKMKKIYSTPLICRFARIIWFWFSPWKNRSHPWWNWLKIKIIKIKVISNQRSRHWFWKSLFDFQKSESCPSLILWLDKSSIMINFYLFPIICPFKKVICF